MLAQVAITPWHWAGFILCVLFFLALDLGVFHRRAHTVTFKEALGWTLTWVTISMLFAVALIPWRGRQEAVEFVTGYIIELSLSMDNVFVIALIFTYFRVPAQYQHRVLFWGIIGALVMRGAMIAVGAALIERFVWLLYLLGAFLVVTAIRMLAMGDDDEVKPGKKSGAATGAKDVSSDARFRRPKVYRARGGKFALTPLALVLIAVETTDLIFALDSIPAIFAVTTKPFIVFTSNVFAILGLRSLYFVLAGMIDYFRYLKIGLSLVLAFIGIKMLLDPHSGTPRWFQVDIPTGMSLIVVGGIILTSIIFSVAVTQREKRRGAHGKKDKS